MPSAIVPRLPNGARVSWRVRSRRGRGTVSSVVLVRIESVYGSPTAYPANENGRRFAAMTGCQTLRPSDLRRIQALGFEVVVEERGADLLAMMGVSA